MLELVFHVRFSFTVKDEGIDEDITPVFNISALESTMRFEQLHHNSNNGK